MRKVGILAFGSVMYDPKKEIEDATESRVSGVITEFKVEFARSSKTRARAPTLAVVQDGGAFVQGTLFILKSNISLSEAKNILFRREMNKTGDLSLEYLGVRDWIEIKQTRAILDCSDIIFASMIPNISNLTPKRLAELAIASADEGPTDKEGNRRDGIQYLYDIRKMGISTPLMKPYENEVLSLLHVDSLEKALEVTKKA